MRKAALISFAMTVVFVSEVQAGNCRWITNPTNITFGTYSVFGGGSLTATSQYTVRCTPHTTGMVQFTSGLNSGTYFPRYMTNGGDDIGYNLYQTAAQTTVLGDGSGGTTSVDLANGTPQQKEFAETIYAAAPQGSDVPPGTYTDTVTAILSWDNFASSVSVTFTITTVVQAECNVSTVAVDFGTYDPVGAHAAAPRDATGTVNVYCTSGTSVTVSLGNGQNFAGGFRRMAGPPTSFLNYLLYRNAGRTNIWTTAPNTVTGTSTSHLTPINGGMTVYGRIPGGQDPIVGTHADTVLATVNY
jgi:spore coat protein U-like protein